MEKLKTQSELIGQDTIKNVENEWPKLIANIREHLEKGASPEHPEVKQLAGRWKELMSLFSGGDPEITKAAERYYRDHPDKAAQSGIDRQLYEFITKSISAL